MYCKQFSASTVSLKAGVSVLFVAFLLHVVGFSLPQWSTSDNHSDSRQFESDPEFVFRFGLWKDCMCGNAFGLSGCACIPKTTIAGSFEAVQALEITGLVGMFFSGLFSVILLLSCQHKRLKAINIIFVLGAALSIGTGCILYADKINGNNAMFTTIQLYISVDFDRYRLGVSFFLCSIAGVLCLIVCPILFVFDYRTANSVNRPEDFHNTMVSNQDLMTTTPSSQVVVQCSGQQPICQMAAEVQSEPPPAYTRF